MSWCRKPLMSWRREFLGGRDEDGSFYDDDDDHDDDDDDDDNDDDDDLFFLKIACNRNLIQETLSTPRTPRLPSSNTTRFVDFPHKTEFSTRKPVRMADCALHNESKRSLSMSSLTSDVS
eukprot:495095-Hanusia_phi.AAC.3